MKTRPQLLSLALAGAAWFLPGGMSFGQITVKVDSTKTWLGWMNVFNMDNSYAFGQAWGLADLRAAFEPGRTNATRVVLRVNTNTFNTNGYWNLADGTPNKMLEANLYVDVGTLYAGQDVTFIGRVESNSLPAGWTAVAVIKEFAPGYAYLGDTRTDLVPGWDFSVTRYIRPGNITQYGFLVYGPNARPGSPEAAAAVSIVVDNEDPSITVGPRPQRILAGGTARFSVTATSSSRLSYQWKRDGVPLTEGGRFQGVQTATLVIQDAKLEDAGFYTVTVSSLAGTRDSQPVRLRVLTPSEFANWLDNPGFELDVELPAQVPPPWFNFSGAALASTNEFYGDQWDYPVQAKEGTNVVRIYNAGEWNGVFQDQPAAPGDIFTADGWFWLSSQDALAGNTSLQIEVQFRAGPVPIAMWVSSPVGPDAPKDQWLYLEATNGVPAGWTQVSTENARYLVAPPGTETVRFQLTLHNRGGGTGNVYADALRLMKKERVRITARRVGAQVELLWPTQGATQYQIIAAEHLAQPAWAPVGSPLSGDGTVKTVTIPLGSQPRFFMVLTL
ncbi:MAG: immunoglobulin domain-containing protein [Verrucomicrobiota bacterium]|nr:immunoglobulin domain-containing protein [Limisphaera sp.]MDW8382683.1 immunoglobulin domain-containing protein [Verrucomicrobiota bacterium]